MFMLLSSMLEQSVEGFGALQTEILIFALAILTHAAFRGVRLSRTSTLKSKGVEGSCSEVKIAARKSNQVEFSNVANRRLAAGPNYHDILRRHAQNGAFIEIRAILDEMRQKNVQPSHVTFNEMVDICKKRSLDDAWKVVDNMQTFGVKPDRVTCSILLKDCCQETVSRVLCLLNDMDVEPDEVLLNAFIEACIRIGCIDLLSAYLQQLRESRKIVLRSSHAYASLIRAYGYAGDIAGVWETWHDMRKNRITPTSVALGCIVDALTSNDQTDASYELLQEMLRDPVCKPLVNAVIYGSVLKGFSHQKRFQRVWSVYKEMLEHNLKCSIVTFNTLLDACTRSGEMARIPEFLKSMEGQGIQPNLITYGIVIKGYCQENKLDEALQIWENMVSSTNLKPDEIMYNTILDGCARKGLYERGMVLLGDMQKSGIRPTNFTLSVLVKLTSRANLLDRAFEICAELSGKYKFRLNIHVFNNLISGCVAHGQMKRAFDVVDQLVRERVRPDARTYTLLIQACIAAGDGKNAASLIRAAFGLGDMHPLMAKNANYARLQKGLPSDFVMEVLNDVSGHCDENELAIALLKDLRSVPSLRLPAQMHLRFANKAIRK